MAFATFANITRKSADTFLAGDDRVDLSDLNALAASPHVVDRNLYAIINGVEAEKIGETGNTDRVFADIGDDDVIALSAHGLINNNSFGDLTSGIGFGSFGFGLDNAPESGNRWLNAGDSITFTIGSDGGVKQALLGSTFVVAAEAAQTDVVIDFDGTTVVKTGVGQLVGALETKAAVDGILLTMVDTGTTVTLDVATRLITYVSGGSTVNVAIDPASYARLGAVGFDQLTIGAANSNVTSRFTILDLEIEYRAFDDTYPNRLLAADIDLFSGATSAGLGEDFGALAHIA
jgi:hypothetical protein